ncbi:hypothetical protein DFJ74DRAFT_714574 [Hyaloraphidium curvatum]|nr:hypothetical protein DFJ74DRAFT_714574 [Hyaloraphidium curvatum]
MPRLPPAVAAGAVLLALALAALPAAAQVPSACLAAQRDPEIPEFEHCSCPMNDEVDAFRPGVDYFPDKAVSNNPQFWRIDYYNSYKVITNFRDGETYVLYLCSTPPPNATNFAPNAKFFQIPLQRVMIGDIGLLAFFTRLGLLPAIGYVPDPSDLAGGCGQRLVELGRIRGIPETEGVGDSVDAAFVTSGELLNRTATNGSGRMLVPPSLAVRVPIRLDPSPISRMEYILFLSAFWNLEESARRIWAQGVGQYECNVNQIKLSVLRRPVVAWLRREPSGFFITPEHPYRTSILLSAGANAMVAQQPVSLADVQKGLLGADFIIDETERVNDLEDFLSVYQLNSTGLFGKSPYRFLERRQVWRVDKVKPSPNSLSSGFAQLSLSTADILLADVLAAVYPSYNPGISTRWLRNIAVAEPVLQNTPLSCQTTAQVSAPGPNVPRDLCPSAPFPNGNPWAVSPPDSSSGVSSAPPPSPVNAPPPQGSTVNVVAISVGVTLGVVALLVGGVLFWGHRRHGWFAPRGGSDGPGGKPEGGGFVKLEDDFAGVAGRRGTKIPDAPGAQRGDSAVDLA